MEQSTIYISLVYFLERNKEKYQFICWPCISRAAVLITRLNFSALGFRLMAAHSAERKVHSAKCTFNGSSAQFTAHSAESKVHRWCQCTSHSAECTMYSAKCTVDVSAQLLRAAQLHLMTRCNYHHYHAHHHQHNRHRPHHNKVELQGDQVQLSFTISLWHTQKWR